MMSQTHILMASTLLAKPEERLRNCAVLMGAIIPDLAIYALLFWSKIEGIPESKVWQELYWQEPWQSWTAAGNSIPLYLLVLIAGMIAIRQFRSAFQIGVVAIFFSIAALVHIAGDLPVHVHDAHRHFWPLFDWKFISPISYWNPRYHGQSFVMFEAVMAVVLCIILFRRFEGKLLRALLALTLLAYIAVPVYFSYSISG